MRIVPAKLVELKGVVPLELIGAMCSPTVGGGGETHKEGGDRETHNFWDRQKDRQRFI